MGRYRQVFAWGAVLVLASQSAHAQPPGPQLERPTFSPYLNLMRRDTSPAVNYYGAVRPQLATQAAFQSVRQQLGSLQATQPVPPMAQIGPSSLPITGQSVTFLDTSGYFLTLRAATGLMAVRPVPMPTAVMRPPVQDRSAMRFR